MSEYTYFFYIRYVYVYVEMGFCVKVLEMGIYD